MYPTSEGAPLPTATRGRLRSHNGADVLTCAMVVLLLGYLGPVAADNEAVASAVYDYGSDYQAAELIAADSRRMLREVYRPPSSAPAAAAAARVDHNRYVIAIIVSLWVLLLGATISAGIVLRRLRPGLDLGSPSVPGPPLPLHPEQAGSWPAMEMVNLSQAAAIGGPASHGVANSPNHGSSAASSTVSSTHGDPLLHERARGSGQAGTAAAGSSTDTRNAAATPLAVWLAAVAAAAATAVARRPSLINILHVGIFSPRAQAIRLLVILVYDFAWCGVFFKYDGPRLALIVATVTSAMVLARFALSHLSLLSSLHALETLLAAQRSDRMLDSTSDGTDANSTLAGRQRSKPLTMTVLVMNPDGDLATGRPDSPQTVHAAGKCPAASLSPLPLQLPSVLQLARSPSSLFSRDVAGSSGSGLASSSLGTFQLRPAVTEPAMLRSSSSAPESALSAAIEAAGAVGGAAAAAAAAAVPTRPADAAGGRLAVAQVVGQWLPPVPPPDAPLAPPPPPPPPLAPLQQGFAIEAAGTSEEEAGNAAAGADDAEADASAGVAGHGAPRVRRRALELQKCCCCCILLPLWPVFGALMLAWGILLGLLMLIRWAFFWPSTVDRNWGLPGTFMAAITSLFGIFKCVPTVLILLLAYGDGMPMNDARFAKLQALLLISVCLNLAALLPMALTATYTHMLRPWSHLEQLQLRLLPIMQATIAAAQQPPTIPLLQAAVPPLPVLMASASISQQEDSLPKRASSSHSVRIASISGAALLNGNGGDVTGSIPSVLATSGASSAALMPAVVPYHDRHDECLGHGSCDSTTPSSDKVLMPGVSTRSIQQNGAAGSISEPVVSPPVAGGIIGEGGAAGQVTQAWSTSHTSISSHHALPPVV